MKLKDISHYVIDKISSDSINLNQYVTTDSLLQNKAGKENAINLPPQRCLLTHFQKGDILIGNIRPYLKKIWQADHDGACNADVLVLRANKQSDSDYLFALLLQDSFYDYVMQGAKGSKMPRGDKNQIMDFEIPSKTDNERQNIGQLISNIRNKIDTLKEINRNLEALARQLYDYWFVQFDFPDENGKPYKSSGGKMVWNQKLKREIPEGWEIKRLDSLTVIFTGKKDVSKVTPGEFKFFSCAPDPITSDEYIFDDEVILVSGNGSYTGRVSFYKGKGDLYQRTYACKCKVANKKEMPFLYETMKTLFEPYHSGGKHGSSIPYIVLEDLAGFSFPYERNIVEKYCNKIQSAFYLFNYSILKDIVELNKILDYLLPLLMNGQISVKQTEIN